jgi:hypothetical protein
MPDTYLFIDSTDTWWNSIIDGARDKYWDIDEIPDYIDADFL